MALGNHQCVSLSWVWASRARVWPQDRFLSDKGKRHLSPRMSMPHDLALLMPPLGPVSVLWGQQSGHKLHLFLCSLCECADAKPRAPVSSKAGPPLATGLHNLEFLLFRHPEVIFMTSVHVRLRLWS